MLSMVFFLWINWVIIVWLNICVLCFLVFSILVVYRWKGLSVLLGIFIVLIKVGLIFGLSNKVFLGVKCCVLIFVLL